MDLAVKYTACRTASRAIGTRPFRSRLVRYNNYHPVISEASQCLLNADGYVALCKINPAQTSSFFFERSVTRSSINKSVVEALTSPAKSVYYLIRPNDVRILKNSENIKNILVFLYVFFFLDI